MSKSSNGSLCLTTLIEQAKLGHSAFSKSDKNGKIYFNVTLWENDEADQYGNNFALQLNSTEERKATDGGGKPVYLGNLKYNKKKEVPVASKEIDAISKDLEDVPF